MEISKLNQYNQKAESYSKEWQEQQKLPSEVNWGAIIPIVLIIGVFGTVAVFFSFAFHDSAINQEESYLSIHSRDSCEELFLALSFEDRKYMPDQPQVTVLTQLIVEKGC